MANNIPYLASPGSITNALNKIRTAATPERVTTDFITTKLMIKGGTGAAITPFLKKINFVSPDGSPTDLYKNFRNPKTGGSAVAEAIKYGYSSLSEANEYFYLLPDDELASLIVQVSGIESDNKIIKMIMGTLNNLKAFAEFESMNKNVGTDNDKGKALTEDNNMGQVKEVKKHRDSSSNINLTYTINLNLPQTTDQAVFNAIFKSLKEHLLSDE